MDAETFKKEFLPYYSKLYRIAYRIVQNQEEAEDLVQDTYLKLWTRRDELEQLDNSESFAVTILRNHCIDVIRGKQTKRKTEIDNTIFDPILLNDDIEKKEELNWTKQLIEQLPEQQKIIMTYRHVIGCSDQEIEKLTGLSAANIRVTVSRARKTLREQLKKIYNK